MPVATELDVLQIVSRRLEGLGLAYMLTGSFALAYYATPRMTRDLDVVVELDAADVDRLAQAFEHDFYVDADVARAAVHDERLFNLLHLQSGIKVDLIVRKAAAYRRLEFDRRRHVDFAGFKTYIVSPEDLILSKLVWSRETASEMQRRDVRSLLGATQLDREYLLHWAQELGVAEQLSSVGRE